LTIIALQITDIFPAASATNRAIHQFRQESVANAKVSARQPWYIGRNSLNRPPLRIAQQYRRTAAMFMVNKVLCEIYTSLKSTFSAQQFPR